MLNKDKYKTVEGRIGAFNRKCGPCEVICTRYKAIDCFNKWLNLEAEEEKPLPCPFCGKEVVVGLSENIHKENHRQVWCSDGERCGYECVVKKTEDEAIAAHNAMCRAVNAEKESEVRDGERNGILKANASLAADNTQLRGLVSELRECLQLAVKMKCTNCGLCTRNAEPCYPDGQIIHHEDCWMIMKWRKALEGAKDEGKRD